MPIYPTVFLVTAGILLCAGILGSACADEAPTAAEDAPWALDTAVGHVVARRPATARVFELVGIDYCCGGRQTIAAAAETVGLDPARLLSALLVVGQAPSGEDARDWTRASVEEVVRHIEATHHAYLRRELPRLETTVRTVARVHGATHPELKEVESTFLALAATLAPHLEQEEQTVFPLLLRAAQGEADESLATLRAGLLAEHDEAGAALHRLHELTKGYALPADACNLYRQMLAGLSDLERDMHRHVHLENNVLLAGPSPR